MKSLKSKAKNLESKVLSPKSEVKGQGFEPVTKSLPHRGRFRGGWAVVLIFFLFFTQQAFPQLSSISYSTSPVVFSQGTAITAMSPTVTGGTPTVNGQTLTIAGNYEAGFTNGTGIIRTSFNQPSGVAADALGNIYIADAGNNVIRKMNTMTGVVTTFAGSGTAGSTNGTGTGASFNHPTGICITATGNFFIADQGNNLIRKITAAGVVTTFAGSGTAGSANGTGTAASFNTPSGVAVDIYGNVYVADFNNNLIRMITPAAVVTTLAGSGSAGSANGTGTSASFNHPFGIAIDGSGNLYVADQQNNMIRKIASGAVVTTLAGSVTAGSANGTGTAASFNYPTSVSLDPSGNVYVADKNNNEIRAITSAGLVTTLAGFTTPGAVDGPGASALFYTPVAVGADQFGNVYMCDQFNNIIRKVAYSPYYISPYLTTGLSFSLTTGTISGTPTEALAATFFTVTAYSGSAVVSTTISVAVTGTPVLGPTQGNNYVITNVPRISGITNDSLVMANANMKSNLQTGIQYVDGLGRSIQTVQEKASPMGFDMVAPQTYDQYGREITKYLPYTPQTGQFGNYRPNAISTDQNAFYTSPPSGSGVTAITHPVAQTNFDNSPLNRTVEQGDAGNAWQLSTSGVTGSGHTVKTVYTLNNAISFTADSINGRQVAMYYTTIASNFIQTLVPNGYYPASTLTVTITQDENWVSGRAGTVEEYKDIDGHVVLKRQYNYTGGVDQVLSTYYVYDDLGRLAFVLPPLSGADGAVTISATKLNNLCYQYQYDERGRMVQKALPGKGWEYTVYNTMDQPVATQDANQAALNEWIFTKYDALGRVIGTGIWNNGGVAITRPALKTILDGITTNLYEASINTGNGYTNVAWPTSSVATALSLNYYDNYTNMPGMPTTYGAPLNANMATRGEATGSQTYILNAADNTMLWKVSYYDYWGRNMESYAQHYLGGILNNSNYDALSTRYNFTNAPTLVTRQHWNTASTSYPLVTIVNTYYFDQIGRKLSLWEQITNTNNTPTTKILLSHSVYNEIGQLVNKKLHSTDSVNYLQNITYTYNERSWVLKDSAALFAMQLEYNSGTNKQYNGNIAYQVWTAPGISDTYTYTYDKLNRLIGGTSTDGYNETAIVYDLMGNITALKRFKAGTQIDQLAYAYLNASIPTNQVQTVTQTLGNPTTLLNGTTGYTYDANGNMLSAADTVNTAQNKSFTYNLLNLPLVATIPTGTATYTYDATGNKLRKVSVISGVTTNTDYINGIQYGGTTSETLSFIQTEEGKAVPIGSGYDYTYYLGDNLGNTRITFDTQSGSATLQQQDDYYPFGFEINRTPYTPKNYYLYNKKELQPEFTEYDYGARFYDPVIARWMTVDPKAEEYRRWSPYNYVENDPIRLTDPDGMGPDSGKVVGMGNGRGANAAFAKCKCDGNPNFDEIQKNADKVSDVSTDVELGGVATSLSGAPEVGAPVAAGAALVGTGADVLSMLIDFGKGNTSKGLIKGTAIVIDAAAGKLIKTSATTEKTKLVLDAAKTVVLKGVDMLKDLKMSGSVKLPTQDINLKKPPLPPPPILKKQ